MIEWLKQLLFSKELTEIIDLKFKLEVKENQRVELKRDKNKLNDRIEKLTEILKTGDDKERPDFLKDGNVYEPRVVYDGEIVKPGHFEMYTESRIMRIIANKWQNYPHDEKLIKIWHYTIAKLRYVFDNSPENWQFPQISMKRRRGDCIAEYEEIYTENGIKTAKEIEEGDCVLSYDFDNKTFVYKPIKKKWDKGIKKVLRVHFRNGQHIDVTEEHNFLVRTDQKISKYVKTPLKDIDLSRWWKRKIPIAKKIPYKVKDIKWLNEDLCFVLGHYLAEGWVEEKGKVQSSGYDLIEDIIPLLEENNIPFTEYKNNSGVPCINFLMSEFKEFLKKQKNNSFDIHIQEEILHLPENKLSKILDGFYLGDGHNGNYKDKREFKTNKQEVYSTSSEQWANDIQRIGLQLGKTFHIWKQEHHGGLGKKPIYRITHNTNSHFLKNYGYNDISEVSISYVEEIGEYQTYDWEVEDTHNFVFKNGTITHNCEDGTILFITLCKCAGVKSDEIFNACGYFIDGKNKTGHSYPIAQMSNGKWYVFETTINHKPRKPILFKGSKYHANWGLQNFKHSGALKDGEKNDWQI